MSTGFLCPIILIIPLFIMLLVMAVNSFKIVPPNHAGIRERLGRYCSTEKSGLVVLIPFLEIIKFVDLKEQQLSESFKSIKTKDQVNLDLHIHILYQIEDPYKGHYETANLCDVVKATTFQIIRDLIGEAIYDNIHSSTRENENILLEKLNKELEKYGTRVNKVVIKDIRH